MDMELGIVALFALAVFIVSVTVCFVLALCGKLPVEEKKEGAEYVPLATTDEQALAVEQGKSEVDVEGSQETGSK